MTTSASIYLKNLEDAVLEWAVAHQEADVVQCFAILDGLHRDKVSEVFDRFEQAQKHLQGLLECMDPERVATFRKYTEVNSYGRLQVAITGTVVEPAHAAGSATSAR